MKLKPWDTAAGMLLVTEAGGRVSNFDGSPFAPSHLECLASNGLIHDAMIAILRQGQRP
jgi:myo-inositol-1(or 4)-monophosphatase